MEETRKNKVLTKCWFCLRAGTRAFVGKYLEAAAPMETERKGQAKEKESDGIAWGPPEMDICLRL